MNDFRWKVKWIVKAVTPPILVLSAKVALIKLGLRRPDDEEADSGARQREHQPSTEPAAVG